MRFFRILVLSVIFGSCTIQELEKLEEEGIISKLKIVHQNPPKKIPVAFAVDAPLLGNGYTGVAISGNPEKQIYHLARNDFWRLKSGLNQSFPAVLGKLEVSLPKLKDAEYKIEQDLFKAITYSIFSKNNQEVQFKSYVSATDDFLIIEISMKGKENMKGNIRLSLPEDTELIDKPPFDMIFPTETEQGTTENGILYVSRAFEEDVDIKSKSAMALKVFNYKESAFILSEDEPLYVVLAIASNFKSKDCLKTVIEKTESLKANDLSRIEKDHTDWWSDYWSMSYVDIGDALIEKQYYLSNYTLASFSRDPDFPPSIFGTTITKERPHWNGDYHLNYNHYAPYYGLYSSNHIEQAFPCVNTLLEQIKRGKYYSEKICGIKGGILLPVGAGPLGVETTRKNDLMVQHRENWFEEGNVEDEGLFFGQKSNSAYAVVNMAKQFYYTYDLEFAEKVYPFIKGVAIFWENYLTFEEGRYVIHNDAIHEGTVGTVNPILSLGLVRMVMETAIHMSEELGLEESNKAKWNHILENLSNYSYQVKEDKKVFRYTEEGTAWWGDNTLGIQHIYPAGQIGLGSEKELLKVAHNTIDVMQRWIDFNGSNSFFPAAVRVGYNAEIILEKLRDYTNHTYPNGFQLDNPHGIENLSTVPNTINEMMCMGHQGLLRIFPVWPKNRNAAFHQLRVQGAFLVSSKLVNGEVDFVDIISEKGRECKLLNPWAGNQIQLFRDGEKAGILKGEYCTIETKIGERLRVEKL